jgi:hypothetical protein
MLRLVARRHVYLPTAWGLALILISMTGVLALAARWVQPFLAVVSPAPGAKVLVVEGWADAGELDQAALWARQRGYEWVLTSGGPIPSWGENRTYAERAAQHLVSRLPATMKLQAVSSPNPPQDRTFTTAVWVRDWLKMQKIDAAAIDVVAGGVHARRTRAMYRLAFGPQTEVGVIAAAPLGHDQLRWWRSSQAFKDVLGEGLSALWSSCCFWPGAAGSRFDFPGLKRLDEGTPP